MAMALLIACVVLLLVVLRALVLLRRDVVGVGEVVVAMARKTRNGG